MISASASPNVASSRHDERTSVRQEVLEHRMSKSPACPCVSPCGAPPVPWLPAPSRRLWSSCSFSSSSTADSRSTSQPLPSCWAFWLPPASSSASPSNRLDAFSGGSQCATTETRLHPRRSSTRMESRSLSSRTECRVGRPADQRGLDVRSSAARVRRRDPPAAALHHLRGAFSWSGRRCVAVSRARRRPGARR